jgi:nucleoside 2-deoxyribosyltransferase
MVTELNRKHVYLAAPLFTRAEQEFNARVGEYLHEKGYSVFLPQKECAGLELEKIYLTCLSGLQSAAIVVAILDGADADSGTCWECGHAVASGIPVVAVRTDFRGSGDTGGFNAMLYYSAFKVIEGGDRYLEEIIEAIGSLEL